jgi:glutamine synthetase
MSRSEPELLNHLKEQGVEYCYVTFVDVHGVSKTKCVPLNHFASMVRGSELFTVGALNGMGLAGPHYDECSAAPDLANAAILPHAPRRPPGAPAGGRRSGNLAGDADLSAGAK